MGQRSFPLAGLLPGLASLLLFFGTAATALLALAAAGGEESSHLQHAYLLHVAGFTFLQALLSTICSVLPGVAVARSLARQPQLPLRDALLKIFGLPLVLPVIVAILGLASVLGSSGPLAALASKLGWHDWAFPYGLTGILIAHSFFNLPLTARLLVPVLEAVPAETWRAAAQLGMTQWQVFCHVEWPHLRRSLPSVSGLVFLLCFTSFAVVLVFGGGPGATTLEVAIYQALRLEFDLAKAALLALAQVFLCVTVLLMGLWFYHPVPAMRGEKRIYQRPDARTGFWIDVALIAATVLLVVCPLLAVAANALTANGLSVIASSTVWYALLRSCAVGVVAGALALALGWSIVVSMQTLHRTGRWSRLSDGLESITGLNLAVSPVVLGAGLFILLLPLGVVFSLALPLACIVNSLIAVPYVVRVLSGPMRRLADHHDRSCGVLGVRGWSRFRLIDWPLLRRDTGRALALATGLSLGDLTAIALFGNEHSMTLPLLLYRLMASYRMDEAAAVAALLTLLCLGGFVAIERVVGGRRAGD